MLSGDVMFRAQEVGAARGTRPGRRRARVPRVGRRGGPRWTGRRGSGSGSGGRRRGCCQRRVSGLRLGKAGRSVGTCGGCGGRGLGCGGADEPSGGHC